MPIDFSNQQATLTPGQQAVAQLEASQAPARENLSLSEVLGESGAPPFGQAPTQPDALNDLAKTFGVPVVAGQDTSAALLPVLELIAKNGHQAEQSVQQNAQYQPPQQQQAPQAPQQVQGIQQQSPQQVDPANIRFDDIQLGDDASPEVQNAFKQLAERSNAALQAVSGRAEQATRASAHIAHQAQQQADATKQAEQSKTTDRAINYLDSLASPNYGVGQQRSLVQTLASEQVMRTAGSLIRGMRNYGQELPIEQVVQAAIAMNNGGKVPAPAQQVQTPQGGLPPVAPQGSPAPVPTAVGSSGSGSSLMADPEYLAGARAILAR
jgi:hypothetical protein